MGQEHAVDCPKSCTPLQVRIWNRAERGVDFLLCYSKKKSESFLASALKASETPAMDKYVKVTRSKSSELR
jgi:hypothetical protein